MTDQTANRMGELAESIESNLAGSSASFMRFPSGGAMLDVRRADGRAFVMSYTPVGGYGVDELRAEEGFTIGYQFTFRDFEAAANRLRELVGVSSCNGDTAADPELNLLVLYADDLESARQFYSTLGCCFRTEKHGSGPEHYTAVLKGTVFELYPCGHRTAGGSRIGFRVRSVDQMLEALRGQNVKILRGPKASPWGRRAVVEDPMGNHVELTETAET